MKNILTILMILPFCAMAQKGKRNSSGNADFIIQESIYQAAVSRYDFEVATSALYQMIALHPERNDLKDSLCITYFKRSLFYHANQLAEEILREQPENIPILEIAASSQEELGDYLESLNRFEYLYTKKKDLYILYKIASLQYYLKRMGECEQSLSRILADSTSVNKTVPISAGDKGQTGQHVPIAAAALNIQGVILLELNKTEEAKKRFEQSLSIMPNFQMAKANLDYLSKTGTKGN